MRQNYIDCREKYASDFTNIGSVCPEYYIMNRTSVLMSM